ncbi:bifunctional 4-hydroxy-3-methylbut-2-enyl diphosphate reductase/30S ribosomal protein S1 [Selenihalanaerobacter shriftii]|uniref:4-hydroxy-3-methylbut-2-enyl diphosphate reductase n=1 Tax=Selenihalanaerobacter shriftii TaxID=142842 RepID=A0A1T4LI71_9FIRM|nr:bifunctional 4-hydroxy-3-methylbut-2-enyl diphosphate reductase/30S ribosomal protein S1 [Selenihalanaerobacter shriftii]SJZ54433.1 4-hydroxy-3-methylbut-2-enyl diphosphate reductase [Selenihalanaerobacter shriftii]
MTKKYKGFFLIFIIFQVRMGIISLENVLVFVGLEGGLGLEIILADHAGFCFGVTRAMDLTMDAGKNDDNEIYTLGPLIHNPQAVNKLEGLGIRIVDEVDEVNEGTIIIRSHGVPPNTLNEAKDKDLEVLDATCPFVKKAQKSAARLQEAGYQVIISGDKQHPEVVAILGSTNGQAIVIEEEEDFEKLPKKIKKAGIIAQTTQSIDNLKTVVNRLMDITEELKVYNTICTTTNERQTSAADLAVEVDIMIVIGGYNSANTNRLAEVCWEVGTTTYHIETADDLSRDWFHNIKRIGVTAGASTPNWIIKEVVSRMEDIKQEENVNEEVEEVNEEEVEEVNEEEVEEVDYEGVKALEKGEALDGTVEQVTDDGVYVNIGAKSEGLIPLNELSSSHFESPSDVVAEGDEIKVEVLNPEDEEGNILLSKKRIDYEEAWGSVQQAYESGEIIEAEVTKEVKGGLVVDIGLRGFIPASHVAIEYIEDLSQYIGETLPLRIIEVERDNNNVVLSRKEVLAEELEEKKEEIFSSLEEGDVISGTITKLVDFGAFVDIGGVEGLLHISEMSWGRIDHPSDVLEEGEEIEVKVLGVNPEEERISLGLKQILPDPWDQFIDNHNEGEVVSGKITKTVDFGAFMEIEPGVEGLIHISQLSRRHVATVEEVVTAGDEVEAKIINIEPQERRVGLSMKELEEEDDNDNNNNTQRKQKDVEEFIDDDEGSGVTIGDMFGELFEE